ncbi:acylamino-acid-releasing enzyme [Caerostris darwini]|uniref:Acylamino-acid-releasing enzyme n=1 Tax=Caerostris darwini TaxID=1538125 RepID=A0AAV4VAT8_9ARAC|nr:acylamino-acid-releasing enzyme [Caerostris darwini]
MLQISDCAETYQKINGIKSVISATILPSLHDNLACIHTFWSSQDFIKFEKNIYYNEYVIEKESLNVLSCGVSYDVSSIIMCTFSKSGKKQAIFREKKVPKEKLYLEIWSESKKEIAFDMTECKEHGKITKHDPFKCFEWSSDERFLLYTAEEKQPKSVSYFQDTSHCKEEGESTIKGEEYVHREEWGETCVGDHHTVLCLLEISSGTIEVLPAHKMHQDISFGQAKWGPDDESIVFVGWEESPYRLGVWACRNRKSALYSMDLKSKNIECLTPGDNICVRSPRFSPNFNTLIYFENTSGGPHFKGAKLKKYNWKTKENFTVIDLVENAPGNEFPGIYADYLPPRCWSEDGKYVYFSTLWRSRLAIVCVDIGNGNIQEVEVGTDYGVSSILDVNYNMIIAEVSAPNIEPCLVFYHLNESNKSAVVEGRFLDSCAPVRHLDINWEIIRLVPEIPNKSYPNLDYDIVVISPKEMQKKCPLIVMPHGGPHSCLPARFLFRYIGFVKLGYTLCMINYRGSAGFGENNINSLLGNIGTQDVADVQQAALHVKHESRLDVGDIFIFGGSHGGFIAAHLCGRHPDFYKAAVLMNPSIDICTKVGVADIPDWNWVECGFGENFDLSTVVTPAHLKVFWEKSPARHVDNVCTPTLLLLGKNDRRVPMSQGLKYYKLLKARKVPVQVYVYEDNHQLLKTPHDGDRFMQSILWFDKHLSL